MSSSSEKKGKKSNIGIDLFATLTDGLIFDIFEDVTLSSLLQSYQTNLLIRSAVLDFIRYRPKAINRFVQLPFWKREYYHELEETGIAGHQYDILDIEGIPDETTRVQYNELANIIRQYESERGLNYTYIPAFNETNDRYVIHTKRYLDSKYNYFFLHNTQFAPPKIREIFGTMKDRRNGVRITGILRDFYIPEELTKYFDKHCFEYYYFDLYMKKDPGLRTRLFDNDDNSEDVPRLMPTPSNFEEAAGGPNFNTDQQLAHSTLRLISFTPLTFGKTLTYKYSILTWPKLDLVIKIRQLLGRIPTQHDLGNGSKRKRLIGFAPSYSFDILTDPRTRDHLSMVLYMDRQYYQLVARIILGAYDFWDWNDIRQRRYYTIKYLQWIAHIIYLYEQSEIIGLDYYNLITLIKKRAIPRRKMKRPVTMPKTREFFDLD